MLLSLLIAGAIADASVPVREPSSKWVLEYNDDACLLARSFGAGSQKVTFGFKPDSFPAPDKASVRLLLINKEPIRDREDGPAVIEVFSTGKTYSGTAYSKSLGDGNRLYDISTGELTVGQIGKIDEISITLPKRKVFRFHVGANTAIMRALNQCRDDFVKSVGIDLTIAHSMATPAEVDGDNREWISSSNYPEKRNRPMGRGVTTMVFTIGTDGKVSDCKIALSSGDKSLDNAACTAIISNARYKPARDVNGKAIPSYRTRKVVWAGN